ncbi:MAG TPA: TorF family putative porin [Pontiella sp.]
MKKMMTVSMVALMAAGIVSAQEMVIVNQGSSQGADVEVTAEAALVSSYVWRGQVLNNDAVLQPQLTVEKNGVSFNIWGNYDLGENGAGISSDYSEIDMTLAYTLPIDVNDMAFDVGIIRYDFPNVVVGGEEIPATTELFVSATILSFSDYFIPSATLFGDIDEVNGTYVLFDVVAPLEISDVFAVEAGVSAGYGNTSYNDYYFAGDKESGFNDYNLYVNASYEVAENISVSLNMTYTILDGGEIEDAADVLYEDKEKFWGGVNVAYDF